MTFPSAGRARASWPTAPLGTCARSSAAGAAAGLDVERRGVEAGHGGLQLGLEVVVPLPLEREVPRGAAGRASRPPRRARRRSIRWRADSWGSGRAWDSLGPGCQMSGVAKFKRRPQARVLADRELAADAEELVLAVGVGHLVGEPEPAVGLGVEAVAFFKSSIYGIFDLWIQSAN